MGIEEEDGREGLILGAGSDVTFDGQHGEELVDFGISELLGVDPLASLLSVVLEEFPDPADVGLFGAEGHMSSPHGVAGLVEESGLFFPGHVVHVLGRVVHVGESLLGGGGSLRGPGTPPST